ncbi:response regulator [Rhodobacteraceae bacterium CCMM004]|nr:response regulator [Rhodobacteraceae bacterium CCMM004]
MPETDPTDALLDALLSAVQDAILVADAQGRVVRANSAARTLFGLGPDAAPSLADLLPAAAAWGDAPPAGAHALDGRRIDGRTVPVESAVIRTAGPAPLTVVTLHDLTRRKQVDAALARSQRLDAIGRMTGGIAHDFNNLLTIIIGNLELAQMQEPDTKTAPMLTDALAAAEAGADLTRRLLIFARKGEVAPQVSDLNAVCRDSLVLLRRILGADIEVQTYLAPDLDPVTLDPTQLQSAIVNLALNARDAMPEGGRLVVETANVEIDDSYLAQEVDVSQGRYARLIVSDTGIGMSAEAQRHAFEPFFTTKAKGSGLGLSMVYGFVRQCGGHVTLYSEPGQGTSFGLYFPAVEGRAADAAEAPSGALPRGTGQLVAVIEDDAQVRRLTVERLRALGYRTVEAPDAASALTLLSRTPGIDAMLSDLVMPGEMNGLDLARQVARDWPRIAVLLTSGYSNEMMMQDGARTFPLVRKPYRQAELADAIHRALRRR